MRRLVQIAVAEGRARTGRWVVRLTIETVRFHAIVLACGMWIAALVVLSTPGPLDRNGILKGIDFLQFRTAGRMVADGRGAQLYDWPTFAFELQHAVPGTGELLFLSVYPPQLALLFAALGRWQYLTALAAWTSVTFALYFGCAQVLMRASPFFRTNASTWWLVAAAYTPFQQLVLHGQIGALVLVCLMGAWVALRRDAPWWFGAALGSLAFKPPFAVAALLGTVGSRDYRVALAAIGAGLVQAAVTVASLGPEIVWTYLLKVPEILRSTDLFEPKPWQMHNLKGFWRLLLGSGLPGLGAAALSSLAVVYIVYRIWRRTTGPDLRMSALVLGTVLVNPHLYVYDLVVLALPLALTAAWALEYTERAERPFVLLLVHSLCWLPLLGPLAAVTRLQLTVPCMCGLLWLVHRAAENPGRAALADGAAAAPAARLA